MAGWPKCRGPSTIFFDFGNSEYIGHAFVEDLQRSGPYAQYR
jgi:hypothetical protein